jgi:hypothetical protein
MHLRFTIRDLLWLTLVVALAVGWWTDSRSQRYGFRWEQTVTSLEDRLNAQAAKIDALKADNAKLLRALGRIESHQDQ